MMAKSGKWSKLKTFWVTFLCAIGHVGSSVLIGLIGVATGIAVAKLELIEGYRGNLAAWLFILFGLVYFIYGVWKAFSNKQHSHTHIHGNRFIHSHHHDPDQNHIHQHTDIKIKTTPWILFIIFIFGPCDPLIPILMYLQRHNIAILSNFGNCFIFYYYHPNNVAHGFFKN